MDADYLKENIGDVLSAGLTAVVVNQPHDQVGYLGQWLLQHVTDAAKDASQKESLNELTAGDRALSTLEAEKESEDVEHAANTERHKAKATRDLENLLSDAVSFDGLYEQFLEGLKKLVGATGTYMGERVGNPNQYSADFVSEKPAEEEEGGAAGEEAAGEDAGDEEEAEASGSAKEGILYSYSCKDHAFLKGQLVEKAVGGGEEDEEGEGVEEGLGLTFDALFVEKEPEEGEDEEDEEVDEDGNPIEKPPPEEPPAKTVFVPNVLMGPDASRVKFMRLPRVGSYFAVKLEYEACLDDKCLESAFKNEQEIAELQIKEEEEAKAKAEAEAAEAAEAAAAEAAETAEEDGEEKTEEKAPEAESEAAAEEAAVEETLEEREAREHAEEVAKKEAKEAFLVAHLPRRKVELALCLDTLGQDWRFSQEHKDTVVRFSKLLEDTCLRLDRSLFIQERARRAALAELTTSVEAPAVSDVTAAKQEILVALEEKGSEHTSEADIQFQYRKTVLVTMRAHLAEFATYHVFRGNAKVLQAFFYLLDFTKEQVSDSFGKADWQKLRGLFNDELFNKVQAYDARAPQKRDSSTRYATIKSLKRLLKGLTEEKVKKTNRPLAELFNFVQDALEVKHQVKVEEAKKKREEERAEEARLAEEERQAKIAAGENPDEGDKPDEGEEADE